MTDSSVPPVKTTFRCETTKHAVINPEMRVIHAHSIDTCHRSLFKCGPPDLLQHVTVLLIDCFLEAG